MESDALNRLVSEIVDHGWSIIDPFVPPSVSEALLAEARDLQTRGAFSPAGVGRLDRQQVRPEIRGDSIRWITPEPATPAREHYLNEVESIRERLNRDLYLGLQSFEAQFAVYPPGAFYRPHFDRFDDADERAVSLLLYLNQSWTMEDGGALRLHLAGGTADVLPRAGLAVIFLSDRIEHEVLPARRERFSLAGWYRRGSLRDVITSR